MKLFFGIYHNRTAYIYVLTTRDILEAFKNTPFNVREPISCNHSTHGIYSPTVGSERKTVVKNEKTELESPEITELFLKITIFA